METTNYTRPCIECGTPTTGSTGAAGLRWATLCQTCKDAADRALLAQCKAIATIDVRGSRVLANAEPKADAKLLQDIEDTEPECFEADGPTAKPHSECDWCGCGLAFEDSIGMATHCRECGHDLKDARRHAKIETDFERGHGN